MMAGSCRMVRTLPAIWGHRIPATMIWIKFHI
jgi:hypothetical protein